MSSVSEELERIRRLTAPKPDEKTRKRLSSSHGAKKANLRSETGFGCLVNSRRSRAEESRIQRTRKKFDKVPAEWRMQMREVADIVRLDSNAVWRLIDAGQFPRPVRQVRQSGYWLAGEIRAWLERQKERAP